MTPEVESFFFAGESVLRFRLPSFEALNLSLLADLQKGRPDFTYSHRINDRWENTYLPIEKTPVVREVILCARDMAVELFEKRLLALFKPVENSHNPPFWFNLAEPGEITGVHDHVKEAAVSGVYYIAVPSRSGNLFFRVEDEEDFVLEPIEGTVVLFPSDLRHGVTDNLSNCVRISLAFNLFTLPVSLPFQI